MSIENPAVARIREETMALLQKRFMEVDKTVQKWKEGDIQAVMLIRTASGNVAIKEIPEIIES